MYKSFTHPIIRKGVYLLLLIVLYTHAALGQQKILVNGTVTSADNQLPLIGVTVMTPGAITGTITDINGKYSIAAVPGDTLIFKHVSYDSQRITVQKDQANVDVILSGTATSLEQVVVVGYGTNTKAAITGSIASLGSAEIKKASSANLVTGLAGKLPGLRVTQRTSEPGAYSTAFDIRGFGAPLIVVDGIVRSDFNKYDPNDIESITVLKDATAAIYGVKAANGVILVTTKKGTIGKPVISYSFNYELQEILDYPKVGNAYQFAVLTTENEINMGKPPGSTTFTPDDIAKYKDGTYPSTDWLDVMQNKHGDLKHHNLNISGGSEKIKYFTSLGFMDQVGIYKSKDLNYKRYNVRSSVTGEVSENLKVQLNVDAILEDKNAPSYDVNQVVHYTWMNIPTFPVYANNTSPYLQDFGYPFHPIAVTTADISGYRKTKTKTFQGNLTLDYKIRPIEGLSAKLMYGFYSTDVFEKVWQKKYSVFTYDQLADAYLETGIQNSPSRLSGNYYPLQRNTLLGQLNYEKTISEKHNFKAALVYEGRREKTDNMWAQKEFAIDVDQFFAGVAANAQVNSSNIYENYNQSFIGRLNYDYALKYLFEAGYNYGGSSKFPKEKRWGFFPYVSTGWRISEERFMQEKLSFISNLKLRGSWGKMGDDGASSFQFLTGYNYPSANYVFNNQLTSGLGFRGMPNPNITWFTVTNKNIGIDLGLFNNMVTMEFDVFQRDRSGLLATRSLTIPGTVGANLPQENLNKDQQKGFEVVLGVKNNIGNVFYNVSGNMTYTRGQNTHVERTPDGNSYLNWRNNTTDRWNNIAWGYNLIGQFQNNEEIISSPIQDSQGNRTLRPGDLKFEDLNKDGIINDMDQMPITRGAIPDMNFGLNINLNWKQFDMNIFLQGAARFNMVYNYQMMPLTWGRNSLDMSFDRWHHEDIFDVNSPWVPGKYPPINYAPSSTLPNVLWRPDASYIRLKNVEIGYTFKSALLQRIGLESMRINASGFNLLTYKFHYMPNLDPEQQVASYPIYKNYNIGLNVTF